MKTFMGSAGVALGGLATSVVTAILVTVINNLTGFSLFTFSLWFIIPVGAIFCGGVAASGYYVASFLLHQRPTKLLLLQMAVITALTQLLIYYLEYATFDVDGVPASQLVSFTEYMDISLTRAHYSIGRAAQIDTGEIGDTGYWLALLQFIGFMLGGVFLYFYLAARPFCERCGKFFRLLKSKLDVFPDVEEFSAYYDSEFVDPVDSAAFAARVAQVHEAKVENGAVKLETRLLECPGCHEQLVRESVEVLRGEWKPVPELTRGVAIPKGIDVSPSYGGRRPNWFARLT
jgi:hypothetical protein